MAISQSQKIHHHNQRNNFMAENEEDSEKPSSLKNNFMSFKDFMNPAAAVISTAGNVWSAMETNAANERMQQRQNEWNASMWAKNNEYNSPKEQMKRLRDAGLNIDLMYGQQAGGASGNSVGPAAGANLIPKVAPRVDPLLFSQMSLLKAQAEKANSERRGQDLQNNIVDLTGLQQALKNLNYTDSQIQQIASQIKVYDANVANIKQQTDNLKEEKNKLIAECSRIRAEVRNLDAKTATEQQAKALLVLQCSGQELSNKEQEILNRYVDRKQQAELALKWKQVAVAEKQAELLGEEAGVAAAQKILIGEQTDTEKERRKGVQAQTRLTNQQVKTEEQNTRIKKVEADFAKAEKVVGLVKDGVGIVTDLVNALKGK